MSWGLVLPKAHPSVVPLRIRRPFGIVNVYPVRMCIVALEQL
uniref:Uncharacterized protein n=1 Tax=Parascaris equorum TaxID=6256 RepID=A0A914RVG2_PAREQ